MNDSMVVCALLRLIDTEKEHLSVDDKCSFTSAVIEEEQLACRGTSTHHWLNHSNTLFLHFNYLNDLLTVLFRGQMRSIHYLLMILHLFNTE